jgi:thioredoxin reductase
VDTDIAIIGGGPAGLQAALTLGRIHRRAVLVDDGTYRNARVSHMHNVLTHDGTPPSEFRATARKQLTAYDTIAVREARVDDIGEEGGRFHVMLDDGDVLTARAVILATGVRDELPPVPGLADLWGDLAAHCPFCHGHEFAGTRIGILGAGPAPHLSALLGPMASEIVVLSNDESLPDGFGSGVAVRGEKVASVQRRDGGVRVELAGGGDEQVSVLFVAPALRQSAPFAERLGLELNSSGCVRVDEFGCSSRPGVFCAGDMAHLAAHPMPMASVTFAAASGQLAASSAQAALMAAGQ